MDERRAPGRRARAAARGRAAPEAPLHDPRPPEPGGREHVDRAPRAARRARAAIRVPDRRGRRVPRALVRRRRAAEPLEPRARRRSCRLGTTSKTFFPGVRLGWAVGPAEIVARSSSTRSRTPTSAPARSGSGCSRSTSAGAGSRSSSRSRARSTGQVRSACSPRSSGTCRRARRGRAPQGGFFSWLTLPRRRRRRRSSRACGRERRRDRPRARCSTRTAAAPRTSGSRSAWSTRR